MSAAPLFQDLVNGDFHILPGSPGVDAGNSNIVGLPALDMDGELRLLDGNADSTVVVDIGADEYNNDRDDDGVWNADDSCPDDPSPGQENLDGDLAGDACDNCPATPNDSQQNSDADPIGDPCDNCPSTSNAGQVDTDGDLAGDDCDAPGSGNADCDGAVNSVDALKVLRHSASLAVSQSDPCLDIGQALPGGGLMGDVNCSSPGDVNSVDALLVLRAVAGLITNIPAGCPAIMP